MIDNNLPQPSESTNSFAADDDFHKRVHWQNTAMWLSMDPKKIPIDTVIPGLMAGTVGSLVAPGGTGKSFLALELAMAVASPLGDIIGFNPQKSGPVLYLNAEDHFLETARRLACLGERLPLEARQAVAKNLTVGSALGSLINFSFAPNNDFFTDIEGLINESIGYRLIILDTLTRFHTLDENKNGEMSNLLNNLEFLARQTGAAVLFLHHTNKTAIRDGSGDSQAASRGASVLVDNVRYSSYLVKMTPEEATDLGIGPRKREFYLRFGISKQNYGIPKPELWLERHEGGVLLPANLSKEKTKPKIKFKKPDMDPSKEADLFKKMKFPKPDMDPNKESNLF
jgi:RecA-family ATPase